MAIFVLVHGGSHGGWCYKKVAALLRVAGHEVHTPTLTGLGDRAHMATKGITLDTHVADVAGLLRYEDLREVILVGHSYGGMVITGAADREPDRIRELVYLDAAHPRNGEALTDVAVQSMAYARQDVRTVDGVELVGWTLQATFFGLADPADVAWTDARMTPQPWACYATPLVLDDEARVRSLPRTNINCTASLASSASADRARQVDGDRNFEIDTGHDLMLTQPDRVAEILLSLD